MNYYIFCTIFIISNPPYLNLFSHKFKFNYSKLDSTSNVLKYSTPQFLKLKSRLSNNGN